MNEHPEGSAEQRFHDACDLLRRLQEAVEATTHERDQALRELRAKGLGLQRIGKLGDITNQRAHQLIRRLEAAEPQDVRTPEPVPEPVPVEALEVPEPVVAEPEPPEPVEEVATPVRPRRRRPLLERPSD